MTGPTRIPWEGPAWIGLRHFNDRDYFEAHDVWEEIWMGERGASKLFYQAMIQTAVGCYKADFGVYNGAIRLLARALDKFERVGPVDVPFDAGRLVVDARAFLTLIEDRGPAGLAGITADDYPLIWSEGAVLKDAVLHGGVLDED